MGWRPEQLVHFEKDSGMETATSDQSVGSPKLRKGQISEVQQDPNNITESQLVS